MSELKVSYQDVVEAGKFLSKNLDPTPIHLNPWLSESYGCQVWLKMENMHPIGSFKIRGATWKIAGLTDSEKKRGVIASSAGNHGQGVAWGSRLLGVKALIVMPRNAPLIKIQNSQRLGAEVLLQGDSYDEAYAVASDVCKKKGLVFVHPFEDSRVIAGQGTVGLEILKQLPKVDAIFTSMGGGGLATGLSVVLREKAKNVDLVGCQASGASSLLKALQKSQAVRAERVQTFADGVAVAQSSEPIRKILGKKLDRTIAVDDEATAAAVLSLMENAHTVAEGAGALALAGLEKVKEEYKGKSVVVVLSGGNIDVNLLSRIIERGLIRSGRRLQVEVIIPDRPGALSHLTEVIGIQGANILHVAHDRNELSATLDQTEVHLTLETRGQSHCDGIVKALKKEYIQVSVNC